MLRAQAALGDSVALLEGERVCFANSSLVELCGTPLESLRTRSTLLEHVDPGQRPRLVRLLAEPQPEPQRFAAVWLSSDGKRLAVEIEVIAIELAERRYSYLRVRRRDGRGLRLARDRDGWQRHAFVNEASELLNSTLDEERFLAALAQLAVPRFADWCLIEIVDDNANLQLMASVHIDREDASWLASELRRVRPRDEASPFAVGTVLRTGKPVLIADVEDAITDPRTTDPEDLRIYHALGIRSAIVAPMLAAGRVVGILRFFGGVRRAAFAWPDVTAASELGRRAGIAYEHARLSRSSNEATRVRDELLVTASHELRTPLTAVLLQMQSLERSLALGGDKLDRDALLARAQKAVHQTRRLATLVDEMLDVARLTSGKMWLSLEDVDLNEVVESVAARLRARANGAGCDLQLKTNGAAHGQWDKRRVEQIVDNLVSNAIKFAPETPIEIRTGTDGDSAVLMVRDGGPGVAADDVNRIFERFENADRPRAGLGLGLYLTRQLALAHGGSVDVTSEPGRGATFTVRLPIIPPTPP